MRLTLLVAVALGLCIAIAYGGALSAPFIFDDLPGIVRNPTIRHLWPLSDVLWPVQASGTSVVGRPLINLSLALNYASGTLNPAGYRLTNLFIHAAAALTLFGLVRRTFGLPRWRGRFAGVATPLAFCSALMWALHPLQTESVTCVIQRTESLVGLFYLFTLYAFVRAATAAHAARWEIAAIGACLLGVGTKEVIVTAPVVVLLYDRTFIAGTFRAAWQLRSRLHLALLATWVPLILLVLAGGGRGGTVGFNLGPTPWEYLLTQCRALTLYLKLSVWPSPLVLDYGLTFVRSAAQVWWQGLFILALVFGTLVFVRVRPVVGFLGAAFFLILAPSSSVVPLATQTIAEHRMYLPLAVLMVALVAGLYVLWEAKAWIAAAVLIVAFGLGTAQRNAIYRAPVELWRATVVHAPENARAHYNLANALASAGQPAAAVGYYERALSLEPRYSDAHYNWAQALLALERVPEAVEHYEAALRLAPKSADAHANLASALLRLGQPGAALSHYAAAAALGALSPEEHTRYGRALAEAGRMADAVAEFRAALTGDPTLAEAHLYLGLALSELNRRDEGLLHLAEAVRLRPDDFGARTALAEDLVAAGRWREALPQWEAIVQAQPANTEARATLARVRERLR